MSNAQYRSVVVGKNAEKSGISPAIALCNPKYARNVGMVVRLASCFGLKQVWYSGDRVKIDLEGKSRLPREERMRGYKEVDIIQNNYFFDQFPKGVVPVAIEVKENSESLFEFEHPENALYVFGPEDGSIPPAYLRHCHRFIVIPTRHCLNLATAVSSVLYDRSYKRWKSGLEESVTPGDWENRGYEDSEEPLIELYSKK